MFRSGQMVGLYTLIEKLGRGGFGEVWLAEKRSQFVTKKVAVKLPHEEQVNFDAITQEATLWEQASGHPNVLPIIDADVYDGQVVIVSEYADGGSLADRLNREDKLSVQHAVEMTIGILSGLEFLHNRKIIHRDIKPQNILLQGNTPRLADFGISRAMNTTIVSSAVIGTDAYMSPEALDGKRNAQTDIWSVGVVLYQLLKGKLPFAQENISERMFAILTKEFEPLSDEIPQRLRTVVQKALTKQPENRYQTAEEMREDLRKVLSFIENPTFAPTEVLNKSALSIPASEDQTIETSEQVFPESEPRRQADLPTEAISNLTGATEIQTVVNNQAIQPEPTQPSYQQNSVVTEIKQTPFTANQASVETFDNSEPVKSTTRYEYIIAGIVGLIMLFGLGGVILRFASTDDKLPANVYTPPANISKPLVTPAPSKVHTSFEQNNKWGFRDENNKVVVQPKYEEADKVIEGMAKVKLNGKWGFIDDTGREVIAPKYDLVFDFREDFAGVRLDDKAGFIDKSGNIVVPIIYEYASQFHEGMSGVKLNDKYGFIDKTGKTVIPFQYGQVYYFQKGVATVCRDNIRHISDNCALIDKTGKELTPLKYQYIGSPSNDLIVFKHVEKWGFMDLTGKEVIPAKYYHAENFSGAYAEVMPSPGEKLYIDKNGVEFKDKPANATKTP